MQTESETAVASNQIEELKQKVDTLYKEAKSLLESSVETDPRFDPPFTTPVKAAREKSEKIGVQGKKKGYGFVKISADDLKHVSLEDPSSTSNTDSIFVYYEKIEGATFESLDNLQIVPTEIGKGKKGGLQVNKAYTVTEYRRYKRDSLIAVTNTELQKNNEKLRHVISQRDQPQIIQAIKSLSLQNITEAEVVSIAVHASQRGFEEKGGVSWTVDQKIEEALKIATYKDKEKQFDIDTKKEGGYLDQAHEIQSKLEQQGIKTELKIINNSGANIPEVFVQIVADSEDFKLWEHAYNVVTQLDQNEQVDSQGDGYTGKWTGHFSGAKMTRYFVTINVGSGDEDVPYVNVESEEDPKYSIKIWSAKTDGITDNTQSSSIAWERIQSGKIWLERMKAAQAFHSELKDLSTSKENQIENAKEVLMWLKGKEPLPVANNLNEEKNGFWCGIPIHYGRKAIISEYGNSKGSRAYCLTDDGFDLSSQPESWGEEVLKIAIIAKEYWDKSQPENPVVPDESRTEAMERLTEFGKNAKEIPQIDGVSWILEGRNLRGLNKNGNPLEDLPKIDKEGYSYTQDQTAYRTHKVILVENGSEKVLKELSCLCFRPARNNKTGWVGEIDGLTENVVRDFLEANPDLDPRILKIEFRPIENGKITK